MESKIRPRMMFGTNCGRVEEAAWKNCPFGVPMEQFFQAARGFSTVFADFVKPVGQFGTLKTLKSLKEKLKMDFRRCYVSSLVGTS